MAAGEVDAAFAKEGLVAFGQRHDERVGSGDAGGPFDAFLRGVGVAEGNVGRDGVREEEVLLEDHAHLAAEFWQRQGSDIVAVEGHSAGARVVEAGNQREEGGLACAGGAGDGDALAGLGDEREFVQHGGVLLVFKANVVEGHAAEEASGGSGPGFGRHAWVGIEDLEDALGAGQGDLGVVHHRRKGRHLG